jgi:ElaB/YqjD/DUF883 family membrane-anchored ribosome-binding protein
MTSNNTAFYKNPADWLADTVRRKPEALLLMAAGCALLMRRGGDSSALMARQVGDHDGPATSRQSSGVTNAAKQGAGMVADTASQMGTEVSDYAGDLKDRISDTASTYASTASEYADLARRNLSAGSERIARQAQSTVQSASEALREQPLLVAALGLAAGAAVASLFPPTDMERRTLGPAGQSLVDAAERVRENVTEAAGQTMQQLKEDAARRGLSPEGVQQMARDATETFSSAVSGKDGSPVQSNMSTGLETSR